MHGGRFYDPPPPPPQFSGTWGNRNSDSKLPMATGRTSLIMAFHNEATVTPGGEEEETHKGAENSTHKRWLCLLLTQKPFIRRLRGSMQINDGCGSVEEE